MQLLWLLCCKAIETRHYFTTTRIIPQIGGFVLFVLRLF